MLWIKRCRMLVIVTSVRINGSTVFWVCRVSMPTIAIFFKYGSCFNGNIIDLAIKTMTKNYEHTEAHISLSLWLDIRPQNAWNCKSIVAGCCWITSKANVLLCSVHSLDEHKSEQIRIIQLQMTFPFIAQTKTPREMWSEREWERKWIHHQTSIDIQTFMSKINSAAEHVCFVIVKQNAHWIECYHHNCVVKHNIQFGITYE